MTFVVEDGTGVAGANSYATVAEGNAFDDAQFHAASWPSVTADKEKALATATRIIDQQFLWNGQKGTEEQGLQWPRTNAPDPDSAGGREFIDDDEWVEVTPKSIRLRKKILPANERSIIRGDRRKEA